MSLDKFCVTISLLPCHFQDVTCVTREAYIASRQPREGANGPWAVPWGLTKGPHNLLHGDLVSHVGIWLCDPFLLA